MWLKTEIRSCCYYHFRPVKIRTETRVDDFFKSRAPVRAVDLGLCRTIEAHKFEETWIWELGYSNIISFKISLLSFTLSKYQYSTRTKWINFLLNFSTSLKRLIDTLLEEVNSYWLILMRRSRYVLFFRTFDSFTSPGFTLENKIKFCSQWTFHFEK